MPDTLPIPEAASEQDAKRIEQVNRNLRIRAEYPKLRDEHGRQRAWEILGNRHGVSPSTARLIVYRQR